MKRRIRNISNIIIASAAVLAIVIGCSQGTISSFSRSIIDRIFPVTYNVEFINDRQDMISDAKVVFNGNNALISSVGFKGIIDVNDAVFSCTDEALRSQNTIRHGMLTMLLSFVAFFACASLAWLGVEVRCIAVRKAKRRSVRSAANDPRHDRCGQYAAPHAA